MFKAWYDLSNSVNNSETTVVRYFNTEDEGRDFLDAAEAEVEEWNKPEDAPYGGKMSTRYIYSYLMVVTDETVLDGLTMGNLKEIIASVTSTTPPALYGGNGLVT